ncbi:hypothetical protein [Actinokineospora enzanensis]|uniref:hypothetical protein n=1 Tax=Actinokineospora enzanensis TaxID=155975 RepID=UPI0003665BFD|nr:hypothetical protein [Actinokineospora enzanensis]
MHSTRILVSTAIDKDPINYRVSDADDVDFTIGDESTTAVEVCFSRAGLANLVRLGGQALAEMDTLAD